jgi:hypothetical protein
MRILRLIVAAALLTALLVGCGDDDATDESTTSSTEATSTSESSTTTTTESSTTTSGATTTTEASTTTSESTTSTVPTLEQPAIWPAPGVVFDDPEVAAADFVSKVLGVPPNLGEFQQGDSRSGEIEAYSPAEGGSTSVRSVLLLRQLGPDDGWFVLAAVSDTNTITAPASGGQVSAGPVEVSGQGRGFEGLLVIEAFTAGGAKMDQQQAQGGSAEATEPYSATLDLSGTSPGDTVLILVRGGVGLETDTGEFSAIPVTIG